VDSGIVFLTGFVRDGTHCGQRPAGQSVEFSMYQLDRFSSLGNATALWS
jgi:hypothetical protein